MSSNINLKGSDRVAVVGVINPVSQAAGSVSTGWVSMATFFSLMAVVQAGVLGAVATLDAKIEQATSAAGAGAKDIADKAITQLTKVGGDDNKQVVINVAQADLDIANNYTHVRLTLTVGTAASLVGAVLLGLDARQGYASDNDAASVKEIVT